MGEKSKVTFGFRLFVLGIEIITLAGIFGGVWLMDKLLIAPPFIVSLRLIRLKIETKYDVFHLASINACILLSIAVSLIGVYISLPVNVSFISNIIIGVCFAIISWHIQDIINLKAKNHNLQKELEALNKNINEDKTFDVDNCTLEQLVFRCNELNLSKDATELAIEFFINKTKQSIIADKMCIEEKSVQQHKRRLRKKLNNQP
jgi:hypothetical protein